MKQWMKYIAVILIFGLMANHFVIDSVVLANASEEEIVLESLPKTEETLELEDEIELSGEDYVTESADIEEDNEAVGEGSTGEGIAGEGTTEEESTGEGITGEGTTEEESTGEGTTEEESTGEGTTEEDGTGEGTDNETGAWSVTIQYNLNGGTDEDQLFSDQVYEAYPITGGYEEYIYAYVSEMFPQREGYEFAGWSCNISDFGNTLEPGAELYFTRESHAGTTIVFTATWEAVTVNFDFNGGSSENYSVTITNEGINENGIFGIQMPEIVPTYTTYRFVGWLCSEDNKIYDTRSFKEGLNWYDYLGREITFIAQWEPLPSVSFNFFRQDGQTISKNIRQSNETDTVLELDMLVDDSENEYYEFTGWLCDFNGIVYGTDTKFVEFSWEQCANQTVTFTAQWKKKLEVTISYVNGKDVIETAIIRQNSVNDKTFDLILSNTTPNMDYYKFNGWLCDLNNSLYPAEGVISNLSWETYEGSTITCTAQWIELPSVMIEFVRHDGEIVSNTIKQRQETDSTFEISLPVDDSVYSGYQFAGWLCHVDNVVYGPDLETVTMDWEKKTEQVITFTSQWESDNSIISEEKEYSLTAGVSYYLGAGNWKVNSDVYTYTGENVFYVEKDGKYSFILNAMKLLTNLREYVSLNGEETKNSTEIWSISRDTGNTVDIYDRFRFHTE